MTLPASPVPVHSEIRDASRDVIGAEQWLQTHGWREPLLLLQMAKGDRFLEGYHMFLGRLALERHRVRRGEALKWVPVATIAALGGLAAGMGLSGFL